MGNERRACAVGEDEAGNSGAERQQKAGGSLTAPGPNSACHRSGYRDAEDLLRLVAMTSPPTPSASSRPRLTVVEASGTGAPAAR